MVRIRSLLIAGVLLICAYPLRADKYVDHRGHNVDSLEIVVAPWSEANIQLATDEELSNLVHDWYDLTLGYLQSNPERSQYYSQKVFSVSMKKGWKDMVWLSAKVLGQHYWSKEQFDSAAVYYNIALKTISEMELGTVDSDHPQGYTQFDIDDGLSTMYGTLGNLYSSQDSIDLAMEYYAKAGEIFRQHNWNSSLSCLSYNIGETWREKGNISKARDAYTEGLAYAVAAGDSLWIASNKAGRGVLELKEGHLYKAIKLLEDAEHYYRYHKDQEIGSLLETVDYTNEVLRLQKRQANNELILAILALLLVSITVIVSICLRKIRQQKSQTEDILEETIEEIPKALETGGIRLTERERQILRLIADGNTNKEISQKIFLSTETVNWYRKKLLVKFDVHTASALIAEAYKRGLLS